MKICVYDILDYEEPILERLQSQIGEELVWVRAPLTESSPALAKGCCGLSILGYSRVDRPLLEAMVQMGIRHISTRTIGYDHIDTAAASSPSWTAAAVFPRLAKSIESAGRRAVPPVFYSQMAPSRSSEANVRRYQGRFSHSARV